MPPSLNRRQFLALGGLGLAGLACGALRGVAADTASRLPAGLSLPPRGDLRVVLIGDLNASYGSTTYIEQVHRGVALIPALQADLVLCAGDMVAGQKASLSSAQLQAMWAGFDRSVLVPLRRAGLPFAPAMGNHDASSLRQGDGYLFARDRAEAERFWTRQKQALGLTFVDGSGFPFFYSFRQQDLFVLVWDASSAVVPAEQVRWADRSLGSAAARAAQRRLVVGHLPLQAVAQGRDSAGNVLRDATSLRQLMERHDVEAYISGHHHAFFPGRLGELDVIALGALGSGPRRLLQSSAAPFQTLTVLDLPRRGGRPLSTTINLRTLRVVAPQTLPRQLVDRQGRVLPRAS
ncbi:MAG: metallophosphoesterase [Cyanobium sp.]|uniref:metallophosphoesterase family protein n=1 Tax=Synechococcus sp. CS-1333 TaxID=2848638 RepID=UPI000DBC40BF|nr:metallophosphoesterase [Synechococcus sp. CS-1333]MCT0211317.1 metallophosphoesterase [Synechococcus sp. CS-1333]PZV21682.1 MAG: metallophosphoesterase [Cyanobium sp.]